VLQIGVPANQSCLALRLTQGASLGRYQGCKPVAAQQVCSSTGGGAARAHIISHSLTWRCQSSAVLSSTSARRPLAKRGNRLPAGSTGGLASGLVPVAWSLKYLHTNVCALVQCLHSAAARFG